VVPDDGELRLGLEVRGEHLRFHPLALRRGPVVVLIFVVVGPAVEIGRDLVLIRLTVLSWRQVSGKSWGYGQEGTYQGPSLEHLAHVTRRELVQLLVVAKDDHGHIDRAEHGEFIGFLEETALPLQKGAVPRRARLAVAARGLEARDRERLTLSGSSHP
jgi:hypothetical protein